MRGYIYISICILAWGAEYLLLKSGADKVGSLVTGAIFFASGSFLLFLYSLRNKGLWESISTNLHLLIPIGLIGSTLNMFWIFGIKNTSISNSAILGRADILFTLLLSSLLFKEKIKKNDIIAIVVMVLGIIIAMRSDMSSFQFGNNGDYYILIAAFLISINAFFIKKCVQKVKGEVIGFVNTFINTICFTIAVFVLNESKTLFEIPTNTLVLLLFAGLSVALFCIGYYEGLKELPVWKVRLLCLLVPLVAIIANWILYNKMPTIWQIGGGCLVLGGASAIVLSSIKNNINKENKNILTNGEKVNVEL